MGNMGDMSFIVESEHVDLDTMQDGVIVRIHRQEVIYNDYIKFGVWDNRNKRSNGYTPGYSGYLTPTQALKVAAELITQASAMIEESR
jgi:hypothetical protein